MPAPMFLKAFVAIGFSLLPVSLRAQTGGTPTWVANSWQEPQDTAMAILSPDEYAWRLFAALNWPARPDTREADSSQRLGAPGRVVWETWKLVSGGPAKSEVYRAGGAEPSDWSAPLDAYCDATARDLAPLQSLLVRGRNPTILFEPGVAQPGTDEVRMNRSTLEFIVNNKIYFVEGQEDLFKNGVTTIKFEPNSKEIKAQWREIADADEGRYHACRFAGKLYGLTALHILTKDLPNWFWATFEHVDNKKPENLTKPGYGPWLLKSHDSFACPSTRLDCEEAPKGIGLEGTKWENYRLRGTQIDFVSPTGSATRLANSQIETDFQTASSCMSCHARASIGPRVGTSRAANRLLIFEPPFADAQILTPVGHPDPVAFESVAGATGVPISTLRYTQLDFVWSLSRAQRRGP